MKKVFLLTLLALVLIISNGNLISVDASQVEGTSLEDMGEYTVTEQVMTRVKIYIDEDHVDFIESTDTYVYTRETRWYFFGFYTHSTYKYYFYEDKFVDVIVEQKQLYNDIDTLIYMVTELEGLADDYGCNDIENCVLGYIRSINVNYSDNSDLYDKWEVTAGTTNMGFVSYVDTQDGTGIEFVEYFTQFLLDSDDYNSAYGYVSSIYKNRGYLLVDPFNGSNSTGIDVTHLFASIDGAYQDTKNTIDLGNNHQQDLAGWLGDLHTFTKKLYQEDQLGNIDISQLSLVIDVSYGYSNSNVDFCDWVGISACTFPEEDILADIDAMNIAKIFLDIEENNLSNSLSAYYNVISGDNSYFPNRYKMFKESVAINTLSNGTTTYQRFRDEVYMSMNVKYSSGNYSNYSYYSGNFYLGYKLLRTGGYGSNLVSYESREYAARLFYNYISAMSSAPYYY